MNHTVPTTQVLSFLYISLLRCRSTTNIQYETFNMKLAKLVKLLVVKMTKSYL